MSTHLAAAHGAPYDLWSPRTETKARSNPNDSVDRFQAFQRSAEVVNESFEEIQS